MGNILSSQPTETPFPSPLPNPNDPHVKKQSVVVEGTGTWGSGIHRCPEAADRLIGVEDPYMATLYDNFRLGVTKYPDSACLGQRKMVDGQAGEYVFVTYKTVAQWITEVGSALRHVGVQKGANVGIYSKNKTEWVVIEQACNAYTHPTVAVYDTFGPDAVHFVMKHSEMPIVFLEKDKVPALASSIAMGLPTLKYAVVFETVTEDDVAKFAASGVRLMTYSDFRAMGRENPHPHEPPRSSDIAIIMYTSGTTGDPKGVILTHGNMVSTLNSVEERIRVVSEDVHLSFLPLAHCFERIVQAKFFRAGGRIGFYQGDVRKLPDDIKCLQPTIFVGVPRVFNRFYDKVLQTVNQGSTVTQTLYHTAYSYRKNALSNGQDTPWYNTLLFNKFRAALGGRVRLIITGSAPLDVRVHEWLRVCMCPLVLQGYGLTETCAGSSVQLTNDLAVGSCGGPIGCNEFKLVDVPEMDYRTTDNPPRGEVWIRGTNVFQGYYKDAEKTRADLDVEGWFHTGDVGRWNDDGSLSIIDRKKNIFKLAQGEYIAAEQLEMIYASAPHVAQVYVYGDSLKTFLLAVVVPDQEQLMPWAQERGITGDFREVCAHPEVKTLLMAEMNAEAKKAKLKGFEYVKGIVVYGELFSVENNLLTPTFKIKRPAAVKFFKEQFNQLYEEVEKSMAEK